MSAKKNLNTDKPFEGQFKSTVYGTLRMAYKPYFLRTLGLIFLGLMGRGLLLANTNLIGYWVDSFCKDPNSCKQPPAFFNTWTSTTYIETLLIMIGLGFLCTLVFRVSFSRLSSRAVSQLYDEVTLRTSRYPLSFFDRTQAGRIITRFSSDYGNVFRLFGGPLAEFFAIIFDLIVMIVLICVASPYYLWAVLFMAVLNYSVYKMNQKSLRKTRRALSSLRAPTIAHFAETAQGANTIRSFSREDVFSDRFYKLDGEYLTQKMKTTGKMMFFALQMNSLTAFLFLFTGGLAYYLIQHKIISVGSVGVAFSFIVFSGNTVQMFFEWLAQFEEAMIGVERMDEYLRLDIEPQAKIPSSAQFQTHHAKYQDSQETPQQNILINTHNAEVTFENLSLRYHKDLPLVLNNVSFTIQAGECFGIIGRTGSGKSSLIQCIFHLYPFENGDISIQGHSPLKDTDLNQYRKSIALITQDPVLFKGTLRENLDIENIHTDEELITVLNRVGLSDWLHLQKKGLQSMIEERARNLSSGEKQLICMARCILQKAPVVIMDEATSAVDPQSEEALVKATHDFFKGKTQIIVAHRLSTLKHCDRILWLDKGQIREIGPAAKVISAFEKQSSEDRKLSRQNERSHP